MSQSPEGVIREWFEQLWNQKNLETIDRLFAEDGIAHGLTGGVMKGPVAFRPFYSSFAEAFPDLHIEVLQVIRRANSSWFATA
jgi:hypothetical protein